MLLICANHVASKNRYSALLVPSPIDVSARKFPLIRLSRDFVVYKYEIIRKLDQDSKVISID